MSLGPQDTTALLDHVHILIDLYLASADGTADCVYRQWFLDVFLGPFSNVNDRIMPMSDAVSSEGPKTTGIQQRSSALSLTHRDFFSFSESFDDVMHCRWWDLQSLCNLTLRNIVFKEFHNLFTHSLTDWRASAHLYFRETLPLWDIQGSRVQPIWSHVRPNFSMVRLKKIWGRTSATSHSKKKVSVTLKVSATLKGSLWFNDRHTLGPYRGLNQSEIVKGGPPPPSDWPWSRYSCMCVYVWKCVCSSQTERGE